MNILGNKVDLRGTARHTLIAKFNSMIISAKIITLVRDIISVIT